MDETTIVQDFTKPRESNGLRMLCLFLYLGT
jgi:hypothetical protein